MLDQQFLVKNKKIIVAVLLSIVTLILVFSGFVFYKQAVFKDRKDKNKEMVQDPNADIVDVVKNSPIKEVRLLDDSDHIWGDKNAPVQIIFYGDFDCPFCATFHDVLEKVKADYKDKVKIGFRYYPSHTASALLPALAAECAAEQSKFWEMYDKLFNDKKNEKMDVDQFNKDAKEIGLRLDEFEKCVDTEKYIDKIQQQWAEGKESNVNGTPAVFVDKEQLSGSTPWDNYKDQNGQEQEGLKSIIDRHFSNR